MKEEILSEKIITQTEIKALDDVFKLFTGEDKNDFTAKDVERVLGKLNYK